MKRKTKRSGFVNFISLILMVLVLAGCMAAVPVKDFSEKHPDKTPVLLDDDKDGITDAVGVLDPETGEAAIDPKTGKPEEIEGTREQMDKAKAFDSTIAAFLAVTGVGGTVLGKIWGAVKPTARANDLALKFQGVVKSVQAVRDNPSLASVVDVIDETLKTSQETITGLRPAIAQVKEVIRTEKSEAA